MFSRLPQYYIFWIFFFFLDFVYFKLDIYSINFPSNITRFYILPIFNSIFFKFFLSRSTRKIMVALTGIYNCNEFWSLFFLTQNLNLTYRILAFLEKICFKNNFDLLNMLLSLHSKNLLFPRFTKNSFVSRYTRLKVLRFSVSLDFIISW